MKVFLIIIWLFVVGTACSQNDVYNVSNKGVGVEGYDLLSYFDGKPQKGLDKFKSKYEGVEYWFATEQHLRQFESMPVDYLPQYGGWCAYAMGVDGSRVEVNPETYKVVDGKLYLFYNKLFTNTLKDWNKDEPRLMQQANKYWSQIRP